MSVGKKNILFNCTTNIVGGGIKNSAFFIAKAVLDNEFNWTFAISNQVRILLENWGINTDQMYLFEKSPARFLSQRRRLKKIIHDERIDLVYTMAGPAYIRFNVTHIMGISNPYFTHADFDGFIIGRNLKQLAKIILTLIYGSFYIKKADYFIFQTHIAQEGFCKRFRINEKRTKVISNAIGDDFVKKFEEQNIISIDLKQKVRIFCPSAPYSHKAIHLLPRIAKELFELVKYQYNFVFIISIEENNIYYNIIRREIENQRVESLFKNIGKFTYDQSIDLHKNSDLILIPSILETFSSSYLEAMIACKPLIVADKGFAHDICKNAAVYINPFDYRSSAEAINNILTDSELQNKLVRNGKEIINKFGNQDGRFNKIINYLKEIDS